MQCVPYGCDFAPQNHRRVKDAAPYGIFVIGTINYNLNKEET